MDLFAFLSYIRQFNVDVLDIGVAVWGLNKLLQNTLLKKVDGKYLTFVPPVRARSRRGRPPWAASLPRA